MFEDGGLGWADLGALAEGARWARRSHTVDPDPTWVEPVAARYQRFREQAGR